MINWLGHQNHFESWHPNDDSGQHWFNYANSFRVDFYIIFLCVRISETKFTFQSCSNSVHGKVYSIQHYVKKFCQLLVTGQWFSTGTQVSSTNKTCPHDITEILLKMALNTITLNLQSCFAIIDLNSHKTLILARGPLLSCLVSFKIIV